MIVSNLIKYYHIYLLARRLARRLAVLASRRRRLASTLHVSGLAAEGTLLTLCHLAARSALAYSRALNLAALRGSYALTVRALSR